MKTTFAFLFALFAMNASALMSPKEASLQQNQQMVKSVTVKLAWDASLSQVNGYTVNYDGAWIDSGLSLTASFNLQFGTTHMFYVVARNAFLTSGPSNRLQVTVQRHGQVTSTSL